MSFRLLRPFVRYRVVPFFATVDRRAFTAANICGRQRKSILLDYDSGKEREGENGVPARCTPLCARCNIVTTGIVNGLSKASVRRTMYTPVKFTLTRLEMQADFRFVEEFLSKAQNSLHSRHFLYQGYIMY